MQAIEALKAFFSKEMDIVAVYLYGRYADERTWPDTDIEVALLFRDELGPDEISAYLERLPGALPLGGNPGILLPIALNIHILPVIYEILSSGTLIVENSPKEREAFIQIARSRVEEERQAMLEEARMAILQARNLPFQAGSAAVHILPQPPRSLDPLRIGWRLARVLTSFPLLEQMTRDVEATSRDPERVGQAIGLFMNAAGAVTGIAKAMLLSFDIPRPNRRWQVFFPLADAGLITMELALQMALMVETRWQFMTASGFIAPDRALTNIRWLLPPLLSFARLSAWYTEVPGPEGKTLH
ncbi:MAG: nucleotidyltransferase domain-containing protein [Armatimonadota bacterium]|nr:nucleotidyltransferase domain-containing protein [Armatimonadota bacterium]